MYDSVFFHVFCIPQNIAPKSKWNVKVYFFKIVFDRLFLSTPNKNRPPFGDLSINFANINTTLQ